MPSVKSRAVRSGAKYLITHQRGRITRFVVRFALRRLSTRLGVETIPAVRGSRLTTVVGVFAVAAGIIVVVRRSARGGPAPTGAPSAITPFPAAAAPPETRDAPSVNPTTSQAAEAAAANPGADEVELVARVEAKLVGGEALTAIDVEASAGVITLRGEVADEDAEARVVRDAETVHGVKAVRSELKTAGDQAGPATS